MLIRVAAVADEKRRIGGMADPSGIDLKDGSGVP
jgi:hypothetical protein